MPTAQPVFKFTYEDYRTAPSDKRYELVDGDLVMVPAPNLKHQAVQVRLGERLARFVRENGLGQIAVTSRRPGEPLRLECGRSGRRPMPAPA